MAIIVFKEFTQPVKNLFVNIARHNHFFRKYICKPPAHAYHWCESSLLMLITKDTKNCGSLTEEQFIDLGSAIWAEIVVFICCSKVVLLETNRQSKKEEDKEIGLRNHEEDLIEAITILEHRLNQHYFAIKQIIAALEELDRPLERSQTPESTQEA